MVNYVDWWGTYHVLDTDNTRGVLFTDVDGVLTDGGVYYSSKGEVTYRFDTCDGHGFELLRRNNILCVMITGSEAAAIHHRAVHLDIPLIVSMDKYQDALDFLRAVDLVGKTTTAFIGNDTIDISLLEVVDFKGCPPNAGYDVINTVAQMNGYICMRPAGSGAFRDFSEQFIKYINGEYT